MAVSTTIREARGSSSRAEQACDYAEPSYGTQSYCNTNLAHQATRLHKLQPLFSFNSLMC
jgi:hypothetical protein